MCPKIEFVEKSKMLKDICHEGNGPGTFESIWNRFRRMTTLCFSTEQPEKILELLCQHFTGCYILIFFCQL
jgi:hypothetical protein